MKKAISLALTLGIMAGAFSVSASAASVTSAFSGTQFIEKNKTVSIYFTAASQPSVVTGNSGIAVVRYGYHSGSKYYYYLTMKGNPGASTGVYAGLSTKSRPLAFVAKVAGGTPVSAQATCSKSGTVDVTAGDSFTFTVTSTKQTTVASGNFNSVSIAYVGNSGNTYTYRLYAASGVTGGVGIYVNGSRAFVANVVNNPTTGESSLADVRTVGAEMIKLANAERAKVGIAPLVEDSNLDKVSDIRAQEASVRYSHGRPNDKSWDELAAIVGLQYYPSEVLLTTDTTDSLTNIMKGWMDDPAHADAILTGAYTHAGASYYVVGGTAYYEMSFDQE